MEHKLSGVGNIEIKNFSGAATDPVPLYQEFQQQSQLLTTANNFSLLVRLVKGWDLQWFVFFPDKKMQQLLIDAATDFWFRVDGIMNGKADAVLAASIFHFKEFTIYDTKRYLKEKGICIRLT